MFKHLLNRFRDIFGGVDATPVMTQNDLLQAYAAIFEAVKRAKTLTDLLDARTEIREFQKIMIDSKQELWGRKYTKTLHQLWSVRYSQWKQRRGA